VLSNVLSFASDACVTHQPLVHGVPNGQSSIVFIPWFSWGTAVSKSTTVRLASSLFLHSRIHFLVHSWSIICYRGFQSAAAEMVGGGTPVPGEQCSAVCIVR